MKTNLIIAIVSFAMIAGLTVARNNMGTEEREYKRSVGRDAMEGMVEKGEVYRGEYDGFVSYVRIDGDSIYIRSNLKDEPMERGILQKGRIEKNKAILNQRFGLFDWQDEEPYITDISFDDKEMILDGIRFGR